MDISRWIVLWSRWPPDHSLEPAEQWDEHSDDAAQWLLPHRHALVPQVCQWHWRQEGGFWNLCPDLYWWYAMLLFNCVWVCMSFVLYVILSWPLLMVCHVTLRLYVRKCMYVTLSWHLLLVICPVTLRLMCMHVTLSWHLVTYWWLVYHVSLRLCVSVCMHVTFSWHLVTYWWLVYHVSLRLCVSVCMHVTLSWHLVTFW